MEFPADAQIYVDNDGGPNSGILEFSLSGQKNSSFYIPEDFPATFAVSGNLLYAVSEPLGANSDSLSVYNASTGSLLQSNLITGLASYSMAVSGNDLYIGSNVGTVGIFNASTGSFEDLVAGSSYITRFAVGGNTLYGVEQSSPGSYTYNIYTFNATTGAQTSSTPLVTGLYGASDSRPVVSGNLLYVESQGPIVGNYYSAGSIGVYNATTGAPINASLLTGLSDPTNLSLYGNDLFVDTDDVVQEYTTSGVLVSSNVLPNFDGGILDLAVAPEPSTNAMLVVGLGLLAFLGIRSRRVRRGDLL